MWARLGLIFHLDVIASISLCGNREDLPRQRSQYGLRVAVRNVRNRGGIEGAVQRHLRPLLSFAADAQSPSQLRRPLEGGAES